MARKLKVFRTPIGFHDAYVAATSQKAALAAWGADANLFARGVAEEVTDEALTAEPLARPGDVIRKVRGTLAEHRAARPPTPARKKHSSAGDASPTTARQPGKPEPKPKPRPSREELAAAEQALGDAEDEHAVVMHDLAKREAALSRERKQAERSRARSLERLENARDDAAARYEAAIAEWRAR